MQYGSQFSPLLQEKRRAKESQEGLIWSLEKPTNFGRQTTNPISLHANLRHLISGVVDITEASVADTNARIFE